MLIGGARAGQRADSAGPTTRSNIISFIVPSAALNKLDVANLRNPAVEPPINAAVCNERVLQNKRLCLLIILAANSMSPPPPGRSSLSTR